MILKKIKENKEFILQIIEIILIIIFGIFIVSTVNIKTTPELGFCPYVHSGSQSGTNEGYICNAKQFEITTENKGPLRIETEIFNKGLALALDIEIEINVIGSIFEITESKQYSKNLIDNYEDNQKTGSSAIIFDNKTGITRIRERIHVLKPTDSKKITKIFPEDFGFYIRPSEVIFTLKENGKIVDTKTIFVNYSYREKCRVTSPPYPPFAIAVLAKSNDTRLDSAIVFIKNLQTGAQNSYVTNNLGEMTVNLVNFDSCWNNGDTLEIKICKDKICSKEDYSKIDERKGFISVTLDLFK